MNVDELQSDKITPTQLPVDNDTLPIPRRICVHSGTKSSETQLTIMGGGLFFKTEDVTYLLLQI